MNERKRSLTSLAPLGRSIVAHTFALALLFYLLHRALAQVLRIWGEDLPPGIGPNTVPLWAIFQPKFPDEWLLPACAALAAFALLVPKLWRRPLPDGLLLLAAIASSGVLSAAVVLIRGNPFAVDLSTTLRGSFQLLLSPYVYGHYYPDSFFEGTLRDYLSEYPARMGNQTLHNTVHPPGGVLVLWAARKVFGDGVVLAAAVRTLFAGLCAIPVYYLARQCYDRQAAIAGLALWLLAPSVLIHGSTSAEAISALPILCSMWLFALALNTAGQTPRHSTPVSQSRFYRQCTRPVAYGILAGLALACSAMMTFSVAMIATLFFLACVTVSLRNKPRWKAYGLVLCATGTTCVACLVLIEVFTGFDYLASLQAAIRHDREVMLWKKTASLAYRLLVGAGNLTAFLIGVGLPTLAWYVRSLGRRPSERAAEPARNPYHVALGLVLIIFSFGGFYSLETERIWIFLVPLIVLPAGDQLAQSAAKTTNFREWYHTAGLLGLQSVVLQMTLLVGASTNWGLP